MLELLFNQLETVTATGETEQSLMGDGYGERTAKDPMSGDELIVELWGELTDPAAQAPGRGFKLYEINSDQVLAQVSIDASEANQFYARFAVTVRQGGINGKLMCAGYVHTPLNAGLTINQSSCVEKTVNATQEMEFVVKGSNGTAEAAIKAHKLKMYWLLAE